MWLSICSYIHLYTKRDKKKQEVSNVFKSNGLKIMVEANKKTVNFLDVTLNLSSGRYKPYTKPNKKLLHVHRLSNHPPALLKNILQSINKGLTNIVSTKQVFNEAIAPYLEESSYDYKLKFNPQARRATRKSMVSSERLWPILQGLTIVMFRFCTCKSTIARITMLGQPYKCLSAVV